MVCFRLQGGDVGGYAARLSSLTIVRGLNQLCIPLFVRGEGDWWSGLESFRGFMHSVFNVTSVLKVRRCEEFHPAPVAFGKQMCFARRGRDL